MSDGKAAQADPNLLEHIQELQSRIAFQEDAIIDINKQMGQQAEEIAFLKRYIRELNVKLKDLKQNDGSSASEAYDPANERPPHY